MTVYFLNYTIQYRLTGIEHASLKRFNILKAFEQKIVSLNFVSEFESVLKAQNIYLNKCLNFYLYYQGFTGCSAASDLAFFLKKIKADFFIIYENEFLKVENHSYSMKIFLNSDRIKMSKVECYDVNGNKFKSLFYNLKGFLIKEVFFFSDDHFCEKFYNSSGSVFLQVTSILKAKSYYLYDSGTYFFSSETDMHAHWLRKILKDDDVVFIDKNRIYNPILSKLQNIKLKKIAIIHSTHTHNPNIDDKKKLNSNYKFLLENQNQFSACVVATESQYKDLCTDFKMDIPVYVIPPSYIESHRINTNLKNDHLRILSIGRIAVEKRQEDMIKAMKIVIQAVPNATLELYGMANIEIKNKLIALIESENLKNHVFIKPYASDIKKELYNSHLSLVTSKVESFCIAILDSLEQGTPVISYDIKYGPAAIIDHESNGFLVEDGNVQALAETIVSYYESGMNQYRDNTVLVENNYGKEQVQAKWIKLLEDMSKL